MQKITLKQIAGEVGISLTHTFRFLQYGSRGRRTCERFAELYGGQWTDYAIEDRDQIIDRIRKAKNGGNG